MEWESLGAKCFDAAVSFFEFFVDNADKRSMQKWVKAYVCPNENFVKRPSEADMVSDLCPFLYENFSETPLVKFFDAMYDFMNRFQVHEDDLWDVFADFVRDAYGWELDDLDEHILFPEKESDEEFEEWYESLS